MDLGLVGGGLLGLAAGGELLVRGASRLAGAAGIPPLVVGLTVVALGTSSPELAVAVSASLSDEPDFVIGNVVGSNIYNVLLVLGVSALVLPLVVRQQLVRWDVPVMIAASIAFLILAADGELSRTDGAILVVALVAYLAFAVVEGRREGKQAQEEYRREFGPPEQFGPRRVLLNLALVAVGLALLVIGADALVHGASSIATELGLSRLVIGLTVVALGTSLPELATSIVALLRGERDIAVGNIVGSNLMNLLAVAGGASLASAGGIGVAPGAVSFDIPVMIAVAVACLPIFFTGHCIRRWEGALFVGYAVAYTAFLLLDATGYGYLPVFTAFMVLFVMPLTVVTLGVVTYRALLAQRGRASAAG